MTRDEHRAKCIEAMKVAMVKNDSMIGQLFHDDELGETCTAAFDSLNGIAIVASVDDIFEMDDTFEVVLVSDDLTNPPEGKP